MSQRPRDGVPALKPAPLCASASTTRTSSSNSRVSSRGFGDPQNRRAEGTKDIVIKVLRWIPERDRENAHPFEDDDSRQQRRRHARRRAECSLSQGRGWDGVLGWSERQVRQRLLIAGPEYCAPCCDRRGARILLPGTRLWAIVRLRLSFGYCCLVRLCVRLSEWCELCRRNTSSLFGARAFKQGVNRIFAFRAAEVLQR